MVDAQDRGATPPPLSPNGFWADFHVVVEESQLKFAADAKVSIANTATI